MSLPQVRKDVHSCWIVLGKIESGTGKVARDSLLLESGDAGEEIGGGDWGQ